MNNKKNMVCRVQLILIAHYKKDHNMFLVNNIGNYDIKRKATREVLNCTLHKAPNYKKPLFIAVISTCGFWVGMNHLGQYECVLDITLKGYYLADIEILIEEFKRVQKICQTENEKLK